MSLFDILDGIVSDKEFRDENLASVDNVKDYADSCGELITAGEAVKIIEVGNNWLNEQEDGDGEWSRMRYEAKSALENI